MMTKAEVEAFQLMKQKNHPILNQKKMVTTADQKSVVNFLKKNGIEDVADYVSELDLEDFAEWIISSGDEEVLD